MNRYAFSPAMLAFSLSACAVVSDDGNGPNPSSGDTPLADRSAALTAAQCEYFAVHGKVQICHHTDSPHKPYRILMVSEQVCVQAHAGHEGDNVAIDDPTCQGQGCLPESAPCDEALGCCDGLVCEAGVCVPSCTPRTCAEVGATCGTASDGCGGTLECGPACVTCPCAGQNGWGSGPADQCVVSNPPHGLVGVVINGENNVSGGAWGVGIPDGVHSCIVQFPSGTFSQYTAITPAEYEVCKAQVEAVIAAAGLTECVVRCYPNECQPGMCGEQDSGCGTSMDCGPCEP
jgi:hypothetical protein